MTNLPSHMTRCRGANCRERNSCERWRAIGIDEMAPHGALPDWLPVTETLLSVDGPCRHRIAPPGAQTGMAATHGAAWSENALAGLGGES